MADIVLKGMKDTTHYNKRMMNWQTFVSTIPRRHRTAPAAATAAPQ